MNKLILACGFLIVSLALAIFATYIKAWGLLMPAVIFGGLALSIAVKFGKEKGQREWHGRVISEAELPREIYQVVGIAMYGDDPVATLRNAKGELFSCKGNSAITANYSFFIVKNGEDNQQYFIPRGLGIVPVTVPVEVALEEGVSVIS